MIKRLLRLFVFFALGSPLQLFPQSLERSSKTFDTVSIRPVPEPPPAPPGEFAHGVKKTLCRYLPARVMCQLSLLELTKEAYQIKNDAEIQAPKWMSDQAPVFAVQATMPLRTSEADARSMLGGALGERFSLTTHRDKRNVTVYALLPAEKGPRLQKVKSDDDIKRRAVNTPSTTIQATVVGSAGNFYASGITLDDLAEELQNRAGLIYPVINLTQLSGRYNVDLHWTPDESGQLGISADGAFVAAVKDQLGLRLEKRKMLVNTLIVDSANRTPTEN